MDPPGAVSSSQRRVLWDWAQGCKLPVIPRPCSFPMDGVSPHQALPGGGSQRVTRGDPHHHGSQLFRAPGGLRYHILVICTSNN